MNIHPYPHQLTAPTANTAPALNAGYIAFDSEGNIRSFALTDRVTILADIACGEIEDVTRVLWIDPASGRCVDMTASVIAEIWELSFQANRGEEIPPHLEALYELTRPAGYCDQTHYVDVW